MRTLLPPKLMTVIAGILPIFAISACTMDGQLVNRNPQPNDLVIDGTSIPEINKISVPMPKRTAAVIPKRADRASLWKGTARSLFLDHRAEQIGDILTITININDKAQLANASQRSRKGSQKMGFPSFFGYGSQIDKALPGVTKADLPTTGQIVDLGSSSDASGSGSIKRNETIQLRVAAMVIRELPNGNFVIAGRQEVKVNNELRELRIAGIIRPEDIDSNNTITYDKIAEARITYGGRGQISRVQNPRYGSDLLDVILPY